MARTPGFGDITNLLLSDWFLYPWMNDDLSIAPISQLDIRYWACIYICSCDDSLTFRLGAEGDEVHALTVTRLTGAKP